MKIKLTRMSYTPVDKEHRKAYKKEFSDYYDSLIAGGKPTTEEGWGEISEKLNVEQDKLLKAYPSEIEVELEKFSDIEQLTKDYGSIIVWNDDKGELRLSITQDEE